MIPTTENTSETLTNLFDSAPSEEDQQLTRHIQRSLRDIRHPSLETVQISVVDGHVRLHGKVRSYYQKQLAQHSAIGMTGVKSIDNDLHVVQSI